MSRYTMRKPTAKKGGAVSKKLTSESNRLIMDAQDSQYTYKKQSTKSEIPVQDLASILDSLSNAQNTKDSQKKIDIEKDRLAVEEHALQFEKHKVMLEILGNILSTSGSATVKSIQASWEVFKQGSAVLFESPHISGWVALAIVVLLVTGAYVMFFNFNQNPYAPRFKITFLNNIFKYMANIFLYITPSYKFRIFTKSITPYTGIDPTTARPVIIGRCDNLTMREITSANGTGLCVNTMQPDPIKWVISPESMPELQELDPIIRGRVEGVDGEKNIVNIPWKIYSQDGMNYYPDCSRASFSDGKSASYLFQDNGITSCNKKIINRKMYSTTDRPIDIGGTDSENKYKGLDKYV